MALRKICSHLARERPYFIKIRAAIQGYKHMQAARSGSFYE
jgi:hypothetical protein